MGRKERIQKELDLILEKLRFWRVVIVSIIAGIIGLWLQHDVSTSVTSVVVIAGIVGVIIAIWRIHVLSLMYYKLLDMLEKEV